MDKGKGDVKAPDFSKDYERGLKVYLKYLPKELAQELAYRQQYDPQFIEQQLGLQRTYDPQVAAEQMAALQRRDPEWLAMHRGLGDKIKEALDRGYLDPRQEAAYAKYAKMAGKGEPTRDRAYQALGQQVTGDTLRGATMDPETLRQTTQAILSRSPGLSYGEAQDMAAAVYTGQRGQQLKQARQQATGNFLQAITPTAQREASLANFYGQAPPEAQTLAQAGSYLSSPTVSSIMSGIPGVQAPRAFGYVNPNAGYQGVQQGLQNYQNQLAQQQTQGNNSNPWLQAVGQVGGAVVGGYFGGPAGASAGGAAGGYLGSYFSDERLKNNISRTGALTSDGIPIVEFSYKGSKRRFRGVVAQDVEKVRPDAVSEMDGMKVVDYFKLGLRLEEVKNG